MPKSDAQKQRDRMARLNNKIVALISKSNLDITETYIVLDSIRQGLLHNFRKSTGQED